MKKGMTLVETLIALLILSFILGAVFTILNLQSIRSSHVHRTATLQTDAQVGLTLLQWDLATTGLSFPKRDNAVTSGDGGPAGTDWIGIKAVGLGFESSSITWSWLLEDAAGATGILVRAFADSTMNFKDGDVVIVLNRDRTILDPPGDMVISNHTTEWFYDPYGDSVLAQKFDVDLPLYCTSGLVMTKKYDAIYNAGITISVNANNQLVRGSDILLDNVEDLQFAYGIDTDGDEVIDTWSDMYPGPVMQNRKWAIRYTLVVTSRALRDYTYARPTLTIENHTYNTDRTRRRAILTGIISPQNLQP